MKLYHLTTEMGEARILNSGFSNEDCICDTQCDAEEDDVVNIEGVMLDNSEDCEVWNNLNDGVFLSSLNLQGKGRAIITIDIPDDIASKYEIFDERNPSRDHWTIPPEIASRYIERPGN